MPSVLLQHAVKDESWAICYYIKTGNTLHSLVMKGTADQSRCLQECTSFLLLVQFGGIFLKKKKNNLIPDPTCPNIVLEDDRRFWKIKYMLHEWACTCGCAGIMFLLL